MQTVKTITVTDSLLKNLLEEIDYLASYVEDLEESLTGNSFRPESSDQCIEVLQNILDHHNKE